MRQWSNLPSEVLQITFGHLKRISPYISGKSQELLDCELVCRNWRLPAQLVIYTDVCLYTERAIVKFINLVKDPDQVLGKYVKKIFFYNSELRANYMEAFSLHCPFVEEINSSGLDNGFYLRLMQVQKESRWNYLKRVPLPYSYGKYLDSYATCSIAYRESLESLALTDTVEDQGVREIFTAPFNKLYQSLDQFSCLKNLSIIDHHSNKNLEDFDDMFEKSIFLKSMYMELHPPANTSSITSTAFTKRQFDLDHIAPDPYIETLVGDGALLFSDNSLLYVMHKFPQLKCIKLNENERVIRYGSTAPEKMSRAKYNFSAKVIGQFLFYLQQVPLYHLGLFDCVENMADVIEHLLNFQQTSMLLPLSIKNELIPDGGDEQAEINMTNISRYRSCKPDGDMIVAFWNKGENLPCLDLIQRCGSRMRDLSLHLEEHMLERFKTGGDAYNMATGYILDHIFQHCNNLTHLLLYGTKLIRCNPSRNLSINTSIENLTLHAAMIPNINLFAAISSRLPSLKYLTLNLCTVGKHAKNNSLFGTYTNKQQRAKKIVTDTLFSFDMVHTAFDTFYIKQGMMTLPQYKFTRLCIEIQQTALPQQYYLVSLNQDGRTSTTVETNMGRYGASIGDTSCASICIRCKSIAKVKIEWSGMVCDIVV